MPHSLQHTETNCSCVQQETHSQKSPIRYNAHCALLDFLAAAKYLDPPKFLPPPKIRKKIRLAGIAAKFLKFISRHKKKQLTFGHALVWSPFIPNSHRDADAT